MAFQLFKPDEPTQRAKQASSDKTRRAFDLEQLIQAKRQELKEVTTLFDTTLHRQRTQWAEETLKSRETIAALTAEIEVLNKERAAALVPIQTIAEDVNNRLSAVQDREAKAAQDEANLQLDRESLALLHAQLSEREKSLQSVADTQAAREDDLSKRETSFKRQSDDFTTMVTQYESQYREQNLELERKRATVAAELKGLEAREDQLRRREKAIETLEVLYKNYETSSPIIYGKVRKPNIKRKHNKSR